VGLGINESPHNAELFPAQIRATAIVAALGFVFAAR
jgi:hypothetical protein